MGKADAAIPKPIKVHGGGFLRKNLTIDNRYFLSTLTVHMKLVSINSVRIIAS